MQRRDPGLEKVIEIGEFLNLSGEKDFKIKTLQKAGLFLEKMLGSRVLIPTPTFSTIGPGGLKAFIAIEKLKKSGFLTEHVQILPRQYHDEPRLLRIKIGNGYGADFFDLERCVWKAIAEHAERKTWRDSDEWYKEKIKYGGQNVQGGGDLDLETFSGFSLEQRKTHSRLQFDETTPFQWIETMSVVGGKKVPLPLQLFSAHHARGEGKQEPLIRWAVTTGLATEGSLAGAVARGALEVIERDAFMITFLNRLSPPRIELGALAAQSEKFESLLERFERYNLELHLLLLPSDFNVTIVAAIIIDRTGTGPAFTVGAKADFEAEEAILGALSEALAVRLSRKHLAQKHIPDEIPLSSLKRESRIDYWIDLSRLSRLEFLFQGKMVPLQLSDFQNASFGKEDRYERYLTELRDMLVKNSCNMFYAELTPQDIKEMLGFRIVQVVSPELQPLHLDEAYPYRGGSRLRTVPEKLGYKAARELNPEPHPFP